MLTTVTARQLLREGGPIESLAIAGDALLVESGGVGRRRVCTYELATGALRRELLTADTLGYFGHTVVLHPAGSSLFTTYRKGYIDELDLATGERMRSIELPRLVGDNESWPGDGGALYVSREASTVYVMVLGHVYAWDRATDSLQQLRGHAFASTPNRIVASHDDTVAWTAYHALVRFHVTSDAEVKLGQTATDIAYLAAGERIAVIDFDSKLELWTTDNPPVCTDSVQVSLEGFHNRITSLRGGTLVAASTPDHRIAVVAPGDVAPRALLVGPWGQIRELASHGDTLWIGDDQGRVWSHDLAGEPFANPAKKKTKPTMASHASAMHVVGVATEGGFASIGGLKITPPLKRDVCTWQRGQRDAVAYRAFKKKLGYEVMASLGPYVVLDDGPHSFVVLDGATLKTVATLEHKKAEGLAVSPDRTELVTTSAAEMKVWRSGTWDVVRRREGEVPRKAVTWLDHGDIVVFLGPNGTFGTFSSVDLKRLATRGFGPLETFASDPRVPVVACVANAGKPNKPELVLRLWHCVTDAVIELPSLRQPQHVTAGVVAIDADGTYLAVFDLNGRERKRIDLAPHGFAGTHVRLAAAGKLAVVWPAAETVACVDLDAETVTTLARPYAGDVSDVLRIDGGALVVATTAGRVEWLPLP